MQKIPQKNIDEPMEITNLEDGDWNDKVLYYRMEEAVKKGSMT